MLRSHFYHEILRKNIIAFGTLFNNIELQKRNPQTGDIIETEKVPLAYGPRQKFLTRLEQNPNAGAGKNIAIQLPRLYFEMTGVSYDGARKTSPIQKYKKIIENNGTELRVQYVPVPYNIDFELGIIAKNQDDGLQILEQILPYFQPSFNITLNMIPDMDEKKDIAIVLNNINYEDDWDESFLNRRSIIWSLSFTAKSYVYGPFNQADVIKKAIIHETVGDLNVSRRNATYQYTPKALTDQDGDGDVDAADTNLLTGEDDFGFNEGIEFY